MASSVRPLLRAIRPLRKYWDLDDVKLQLCDGGGFNLSSAAIVVTAVQVARISDNAVGPVEDQGNANPDFNFR
jgi:hypothetical protein